MDPRLEEIVGGFDTDGRFTGATPLGSGLIDNATGSGLCVIDLDTVMPGASVVDFGDCCRTAAATTTEDDPDPSNVRADLAMFEHLARGYLSVAKDFLNTDEVDHLATAATVITLEQGVRFLADFLAGDVYFKIARSLHNLDRARTQFALVAEFAANADERQRIIDRYRSR